MKTYEHARPTGRRKITLPQLRAEAARAAPHVAAPPATPGRALAAFKRAAPALGVSRRVVDLVDGLTSYSHKQDWDGGPGPGPLVWPSDAELEDRLLLRPSQRKAIVRAALDAGFIRLQRSPTGRRWGHRDRPPAEGGRITHAYGFDLSPLAERMAEFERLAAEWDARRADGKQLRREIACSRTEILALVDLATAQGYADENWPSCAAQADALKQARGNHRDPLALVPIAARLRALHVRVREQVQAAAARAEVAKTDSPLVSPAATVAGDHGKAAAAGPEYRLPITTADPLKNADATVAPGAAGRDRPKAHREEDCQDRPGAHERHGQAERPESARSQQPRHQPPSREWGCLAPVSALRGFVVTTDWLIQVAPAFRDWVGTARPSWDELAEASFYVCGELGISKHAWGQACVVLGRMEAISALAVITARHARGMVKSPGGLLCKMAELHQAGTLHLDKILFGLMNAQKRRESGMPRNAGREARP